MAKTVKEMEQEIIKWLQEQKAEYEEYDKEREEFKQLQLSQGTDPSFFDDDFRYNGYIWSNDVHNIVAFVLFGKNAYEHVARNRYHGTYDKNLLTDEEWVKVKKVENGMVERGIIKPSKSGTMCKVLT